MQETAQSPSPKGRIGKMIAKFGFWGAMAFFTIKGLLYLLIPAALAYFSCGQIR